MAQPNSNRKSSDEDAHLRRRVKTGQWRTERQLRPMDGNGIRIRVKHLDEVPPEKVALAFWLLSRRLVEDRTDRRELNVEEIGKVAERLDEPDPAAPLDEGEV